MLKIESVVYICDRCRKEIVDPELPMILNIFYDDYDLCDDCAKSFREWLSELDNKSHF